MVNSWYYRNFRFIISIILIIAVTTPASPKNKKKVVLEKGYAIEEQIKYPNSVYVIKDDFCQRDTLLCIPDGSTLLFEGGSLNIKYLKLGNGVKIINGVLIVADNGFIQLNNDCSIENCIVNYVSYCKIGYGSLYADSCSNILIKKCRFGPQKRQTRGKCSSIDLRRCNNFLIEEVTSAYTEGENIIIFDGYGIIKNCVCKEGWSGIGTATWGSSVENPVRGGNYDSKIIIKNNRVTNSSAAGITINNNNTVCERNVIIFENWVVNGPGIRLGHYHSPANNCVVKNNIVEWRGCKSSGSSTSNRGVSIDAGNNNLIERNKIINVPEGIASSVYSKTGTIIKNNTIKGASEVGITVFEKSQTNNKCEIIDNAIELSKGMGIWIRNNSSDIINNIIVFSQEPLDSNEGDQSCMGIFIEDNDMVETMIRGNKIKYSKTPIGVSLKGKKTTIIKNLIQGEQDSRLIAPGNSLILKDNKFKYHRGLNSN